MSHCVNVRQVDPTARWTQLFRYSMSVRHCLSPDQSCVSCIPTSVPWPWCVPDLSFISVLLSSFLQFCHLYFVTCLYVAFTVIWDFGTSKQLFNLLFVPQPSCTCVSCGWVLLQNHNTQRKIASIYFGSRFV